MVRDNWLKRVALEGWVGVRSLVMEEKFDAERKEKGLVQAFRRVIIFFLRVDFGRAWFVGGFSEGGKRCG